MKKLVIVNSTCNLILAIQLKLTILKNDDVDLILGYSMLKRVYEHHSINKIFNNVYYLAQDKEYHWNVFHFLFPKIAIKEMLKVKKVTIYSDIYFWNPDWFFYHYYKLYQHNKVSIKWHIYGDAICTYVTDVPGVDYKYNDKTIKGHILNEIDKRVWHVLYDMSYLQYDFYLFQKDAIQYKPSKKHVEIPPILNNADTVCLFNDIFDYHYNEVSEKMIFVDTARGGPIENEDVLKIIDMLIEDIGKDNFIVKPHPRMDMSLYGDRIFTSMTKDIPWELYCMNGGTDGKILICPWTSAIVIPFLWFGIMTDVILVKINLVDDPSNEFVDRIWNIISLKTGKISTVSNYEELRHQLENYRKKYEE